MMNADVSFLTGAVIKRHLRSTCSSFAAVRLVRGALTVWTALPVYHNAGHQHMGSHQRAICEGC